VKCDRCNNDATVHEWTKAGGQRHLCEKCAFQAGLPVSPQTQITQIIAQNIASLIEPTVPAKAPDAENPSPEPDPQAPAPLVGPMGPPTPSHITSSVVPHAGAPKAADQITACPTCGTPISQFRNSGLLGCQDCYRVFEPQLAPLIQRAHEGATHHPGKRPRTREVAVIDERAARRRLAELSARVEACRKQLADAVAAEHYERAAKLRDEVVRLEVDLARGGAPSPLSPDSTLDAPAHPDAPSAGDATA